MHRRIVLALVALTLAFATAASAAPARDGWPDTPVGNLSRRWVAAFCSGDSAMRAFHRAQFTAEARAKRTDQERAVLIVQLLVRGGALSLGKVVQSKPEELTVKLLDADAKSHEFVFKALAGPPAKLTSVSVKQSMFQHGGHGGHGGQ